MTIYKLPAVKPYQLPFRIFALGTIAALTGIWLFSIYEPDGISDSTNKTLGIVAGLIVIGAVVLAFALSGKEGMWKLMRSTQWELDHEKILQRSKDGATSEMALA